MSAHIQSSEHSLQTALPAGARSSRAVEAAAWRVAAGRAAAVLVCLLLLLGAGATVLHAAVPPPADPASAPPGALAAPQAPAATDPLTDGLLGYWNLDEGSGLVAHDSSGNGRDGTLYPSNYQWIVDDGGPTFFANDRSLRLPGDSTSGWITVTAGMPLANNSFTLAVWAKRGATGSAHWLFGQGKAGTTNQALHFGFRDNNKFTCAFYDDDLDAPTYTDTGAWHHWACTYDVANKTRKLYRDGVLVAQDVAGANFAGSGDFWIGRAPQSGQRFKGSLDEARVYNRVLTEAQLAALAATTRRPIGYWKFDSNLADASGNGHDGSWNSSPTTGYGSAAPTAHTNTKSLSLDGSHYVSVADNPDLILQDAVTAAAWVNLTNPANDQKIVGKTDGSHDLGWVLGVEDGKLKCESFSGADKDAWAGSILKNEWVHLACTWTRGGQLRAYVNGKLVANTAADTDPLGNTTRSLYIGVAPWDTGAHRVTGQVDDVRVYDRELDADEIRGLAGDGTPAAYWRFDPNGASSDNKKDTDSAGSGVVADRNTSASGSTVSIDTTTAATIQASGYANPGSLKLAGGGFESGALVLSNSNYGLSFWFRTNCSTCGLFSATNEAGSSHDRHVYLKPYKDTYAYVCSRVWLGGASETLCSTGVKVLDNNWHHVVHTFGATVGGDRLYVDGVLRASGTATTSSFTTQTHVRLGYSADASTPYLVGNLDDLRIFARPQRDRNRDAVGWRAQRVLRQGAGQRRRLGRHSLRDARWHCGAGQRRFARRRRRPSPIGGHVCRCENADGPAVGQADGTLVQ